MGHAVSIQLPEKLAGVFAPQIGSLRYRGAYGGRGSGKTRSFATMAAVAGRNLAASGESGVILCAREYMNSLEDSSLEEVRQVIASMPWLAACYDVGAKSIKTVDGRIRFVFAGLRHNLDSIKSKAKIKLAWIDEAEAVSEIAWRKLVPTVREDRSEIWVTWNPEADGSPTDVRFRKSPPERSIIVEVNYTDNPWFPPVLEEERKHDQSCLDVATYAHIWEGAYLQNSNAQVLADKVRIAEFEPGGEWDGPYFGLDYGFAQDPTAGVKCWVHDSRIWVEYDASMIGLELDETPEYLRRRLPDIERHTCRADSARPESTSHMNRHGLPRVVSVRKWPGSVEDGISHLRSYKEIVIHPRCSSTISEARLYSYKTDRLSGDVLPDIIDAHNHCIDAMRYALEPLIRERAKPQAVFGHYGY